MMKKTVSIFIFVGLAASLSLGAEPSKKHTKSKKTESTSSATALANTASGWSVANGVWVHSDGYKFVNGQVIRSSPQTHKPAPKPPTQAELNAAANKKNAKTPAQQAADKAAERERNLTPRPAPQTGSHL